MRIRFTYKNYPHSPELTRKSMRLCTLTSPLYGLMLGVVPGVACAMLFPSALTVPLVVMFGGIVAGPILLARYRKKKLAEFDAEYARLLQSMGYHQ